MGLSLCKHFSYTPLYHAKFTGKIHPPRFQIPDLERFFDLESIDAILISNYHTFSALPWLTERGCEWNGNIYCTKPTLAFARIYLTQLRKFVDEEENHYKTAVFNNSNTERSYSGLPMGSQRKYSIIVDGQI